ncbi:hypothetical protein CIPAW_12G052100 [Carya illinoinensis]|uniref:Uncharacterized protein n=1 Tax=Carya illinoinensis TaxID=32201 RepID=A0A8T1NV24_CARIL|nr:hypothetical protein CIPAW_12G052100 [Carya illinoinensis]
MLHLPLPSSSLAHPRDFPIGSSLNHLFQICDERTPHHDLKKTHHICDEKQAFNKYNEVWWIL